MSVETLSLVLHHSTAKGTDKLVLVGIANHAGDGGAWPSIATLARYANVHERNVQRSIERLVGMGELVVHRQAGGLGHMHSWERPNRYDVVVACPVTCDRTAQHRARRLPTAQADLWTDPVAPAPPGGSSATTPVAPASPDPVAPAPPKPSTQPTTHTGSRSVTGPRETGSGDTPPCQDCGAADLDVCRARQAKLRAEDRHDYAPRRTA